MSQEAVQQPAWCLGCAGLALVQPLLHPSEVLCAPVSLLWKYLCGPTVRDAGEGLVGGVLLHSGSGHKVPVIFLLEFEGKRLGSWECDQNRNAWPALRLLGLVAHRKLLFRDIL